MKILLTYWVIMMILHEVASEAMGNGLYKRVNAIMNGAFPEAVRRFNDLGISRPLISLIKIGMVLSVIAAFAFAWLLSPASETYDIVARISRKILLL